MASPTSIRRTRSAAPKPDAPWLTSGDIARELQVSTKLVLDWIHSGQLPALNLSSNPETPRRTGWRVSRQALNEFLATRGSGA